MRYLGLILLLIACSANAADWAAVRTGPEGDQYFYDRSKLFVSGDEITYWKKVTFRVPQPAKNQFAASGLYRERIQCAEHTLKLISYLLYAADGSVIEYVANHEGETSPIIPDTLGDLFEKKVCAIVWQRQEEQRKIKAEEEKKKAEEATKKALLPAVPKKGNNIPETAVPKENSTHATGQETSETISGKKSLPAAPTPEAGKEDVTPHSNSE